MNTRRKMRLRAMKVITFPRFSIDMIHLKNVYYIKLCGENTYTDLANAYMRKMNYFGLPKRKKFMESYLNIKKYVSFIRKGYVWKSWIHRQYAKIYQPESISLGWMIFIKGSILLPFLFSSWTNQKH